MHRSRFLALATLPLAAPVSSALGRSATPLRVASTASDSYAEAIYAQDAGFFQRAGFNVTLSILASGAAIASAVAGGAVDIGITNPLPLATAVTHGVPFQYLCAGGMYNPKETALCVPPDSPVRTGKDLDGKTVASPSLRDITTLAIEAWVDQNGGDSTTLHVVELPFSEMAAALARGTIAAAPIAEPALSAALAAGRVRVLLPPYHDVFGRHFLIGGWFATSGWIGQNPTTARRFVQTIYIVAKWANTHPDETAAILAKYAKLDPAIVRKMNRAPYGGALTPQMLQPIFDLSYTYKFIDRPLDARSVIATL
jgi:NitT/TauT family transport system substrate-binding protein